jgi:hypothetical protein
VPTAPVNVDYTRNRVLPGYTGSRVLPASNQVGRASASTPVSGKSSIRPRPDDGGHTRFHTAILTATITRIAVGRFAGPGKDDATRSPSRRLAVTRSTRAAIRTGRRTTRAFTTLRRSRYARYTYTVVKSVLCARVRGKSIPTVHVYGARTTKK